MKQNILIDTANIETILDSISGVFDEQDNIYYFNHNSIDNIENTKLYNKNTFNYFSIYNKNIYNILIKIKAMLKTMCIENDINMDKNMYYITSEYFDNVDMLFLYDSGGDRPLSFSGYIILDCENNATMSIDNETFNIEKGTLILSKASSKTIFNNLTTGINFNIAPISMLDGQYKQKWIPIA